MPTKPMSNKEPAATAGPNNTKYFKPGPKTSLHNHNPPTPKTAKTANPKKVHKV